MVVTRVVVAAASLALPAKPVIAPVNPLAPLPVLAVTGLPLLRPNAQPVAQFALSSPLSNDTPAESSKSQGAKSFNEAAKLPQEYEGDDEPVVPAIPHTVELHGRTWSDSQHWMNTLWMQPPPAGVAALAEAENRHSGAYFKQSAELTTKLEAEMKARSFASLDDGKLRSASGRVPGIDALKRKTKSGWRKAVDLADLVPEGTKWARLEEWEPSPDGRKFVLKTVVDGVNRVYLYNGRDKSSRELSRPDELFQEAAWASDGKTVVFAANSLTLNKGKVYAVEPGQERRLLYSSEDANSNIELSQSSDGEQFLIERASYADQETWSLASDLKSEPKLLAPAAPGKFTHADHGDGRFLLRISNENGHYDLYEAGEAGAEPQLVLSGSRSADIMDVKAGGGRVYVTRRVAGNPVLEVYDKNFRLLRRLVFKEPHYELEVDVQDNGAARILKRTPLIPETLYELGLNGVLREKSRTRIKGFNPENYSVTRKFVQSADGSMVPVTLISKRGLTGPAPVYLGAYASYDVFDLNYDHAWNAAHAASLMDRGFVVAVVHARGGAEKGHKWMMDGRQEGRARSVEDVLAVAEWLHASGVAAPGKLALNGYSAGGILVSAALNLRPELFGAAVINMGYLDFVNSLLDARVPSAELERTMYGDPTKEADFIRMAAFSPIDNIPSKQFPPVLINTARDDWAVLFHESLKYAARLRAARQSRSKVLVDVIAEGQGEHGGRHNAHERDAAMTYSFLLRELGLEK